MLRRDFLKLLTITEVEPGKPAQIITPPESTKFTDPITEAMYQAARDIDLEPNDFNARLHWRTVVEADVYTAYPTAKSEGRKIAVVCDDLSNPPEAKRLIGEVFTRFLTKVTRYTFDLNARPVTVNDPHELSLVILRRSLKGHQKRLERLRLAVDSRIPLDLSGQLRITESNVKELEHSIAVLEEDVALLTSPIAEKE